MYRFTWLFSNVTLNCIMDILNKICKKYLKSEETVYKKGKKLTSHRLDILKKCVNMTR